MSSVVVSQQSGFARNASESKYPQLWRGLAGWWCPSANQRGSNRLFDLSPSQNHGTLVNMTTDDWVLSRNFRALDFDGSNDSIAMPMVRFASQLTQSYWFCRNSTSVLSCFVGCGIPLTATAANDRFVIQPWSDGQIYISFRGSVWGNFASNDLNWHHLVAIWDGTQSTNATRLRVLFDGRERSLSFTGTIPSTLGSPTNIAIGETYAGTVATYGSGKIDDYRIYSRSLSIPEARLLFRYPGIGLEKSDRARGFFQQIANRRRRILTGMV